MSREKKSRRVAEQDHPERQSWREEFDQLDPACLVFLNETSTKTAMDRSFGCSASGKRVDGPVAHGHWVTTTLTAAIRLNGVIPEAYLAFDGAPKGTSFEADIEHRLRPSLRPGDILIMANLTCHKSAEVERLIRLAGAEVHFLPAYSPDLNLVEKLFSKLKAQGMAAVVVGSDH